MKTFADLEPFIRYDVIRKIMGLASATDHRDHNRNIGCCYTKMCERHHEAYVQALDRLVLYAARGAQPR